MRLVLQGFAKRFGATEVIAGLDLTIESGEMVALLGPSGCGKSTTLFAIAGIHRMDAGTLHLGERVVTDLPPQTRSIGVVFQNYALYPHMSVRDNIAFPLRVQRRDRATIARKVADIAALVHVDDLLDRRPAELSGGQQQRVALARAMVRDPDILLLDEPLANLDARLRLEMRTEIRRVQRETGITAILVTHDQVEAMSMCDRIAIMRAGRIEQIAEPAEMYRSPANRFVAGFLGNPPISFLDAEAGERLTLAGGASLPRPPSLAARGPVSLGIRPEHFGPAFGTGVRGHIAFVEPQGREDLVDVTLVGGQALRAILPADHRYDAGDAIDWGVSGDRILAFGPDGGRL